jgi:hypothetical protein
MTYQKTNRPLSTEIFKIEADGIAQDWTLDLQYINDPNAKIIVKNVTTDDFIPTSGNPFIENTTVQKENLSATQVKILFGAPPTKPVPAKQEISQFTVAAVTTAGTSDHILISSTTVDYYIWFRVDTTATTDPTVASRTGIVVDILSTDTPTQISTKIRDELNTNYNTIFWANNLDGTFTETVTLNIEAQVAGAVANDATEGDTGWAAPTITQGVDEVLGNRYLVLVTGTLATNSGSLEMIVYQDTGSSPNQIKAISPDNILVVDLSQDGSNAYKQPLPTRDGKYITYISDKDGNDEVYFAKFSLDGLIDEVKISSHAGATIPKFPHICDNNDLILWLTPDGASSSERFNFYRRSTGTTGVIGYPRPLGTAMDIQRFSVSADDRFIVATSLLAAASSTGYLAVYSLEAGKDTPTIGRSFTAVETAIPTNSSQHFGATFNDAGDEIIYSTREGGAASCWYTTWDDSTRAFGSLVDETNNLTNPGEGLYWTYQSYPYFSPDNTQLVCATWSSGTKMHIFDITGSASSPVVDLTNATCGGGAGNIPLSIWWGTIPSEV